MAQQQVVDFTQETFIMDSESLKKAIKQRIDVLRAEADVFMQEVQGELKDADSAKAAALFLAVMMDEPTSGPTILLVRRCLERAAVCARAMDTLSRIYNALTPGLLYRLSKAQIVEYGVGVVLDQ